jgi:1,4-dihydroxy-2-naphthoyl-CoA synthase
LKSRSEHVILVRLNRPEKRNALSNSMVIAIANYLNAGAEDDGIRAVVLAGSDTAFWLVRISQRFGRRQDKRSAILNVFVLGMPCRTSQSP